MGDVLSQLQELRERMNRVSPSNADTNGWTCVFLLVAKAVILARQDSASIQLKESSLSSP